MRNRTRHADMPSGDIVVGVDGGDASRAALRWAVREAGRRGRRVRAVIAWQSDAVAAARRLEDAVGHAATGGGAEHYPAMELVRGDAVEVLARLSRGADLLVVGRRVTGPRPVLGMPAAWLPEAACPVVEVPELTGDAPAQSPASASETVG